MAEARRRRSFWVYLSTVPNTLTEVLFIFPVLLFYHLGSHITSLRNGVDLVSVFLAELDIRVPYSVFAVNALILVAFVVLYFMARKNEDFKIGMLGAVLLESLVYALSMGTLIVVVLIYIFRMHPPVMAPGVVERWFNVVYISAGAGLHEELVFRLLLFGGTVYLLEEYTRVERGAALAIGLALSSVLFALAHHVPPHGEPLALWPLAFRTLAGVFFGLLYRLRGLSVAVYTHMLYDIYVLGWTG